MYKCQVSIKAFTKKGEPRVRSECDRAGIKWHVRDVKVHKDYSFRDDIARETLQVFIILITKFVSNHHTHLVC